VNGGPAVGVRQADDACLRRGVAKAGRARAVGRRRASFRVSAEAGVARRSRVARRSTVRRVVAGGCRVGRSGVRVEPIEIEAARLDGQGDERKKRNVSHVLSCLLLDPSPACANHVADDGAWPRAAQRVTVSASATPGACRPSEVPGATVKRVSGARGLLSNAELLAPALDAMPLFPLKGVVLFPGALLPLHIFEPRYRTMLADCLATSQCMAMAFVVDGNRADGDGQPEIARVAGAGLVVQHEALADGRSNVVLQGRARVWLDELPFAAPYRRARARILDEMATPVPTVDRTGLVAVATAFAAAARQTDFVLPSGLGPGAVADLCAHQLIVDPQARQNALEELDIAARVRLVTDTLAEQISRVSGENGPSKRTS